MKVYNNVEYYSKDEIAQQLEISKATVNAKVSKLGIEGVQLGRCKYYTKEDINRIVFEK